MILKAGALGTILGKASLSQENPGGVGWGECLGEEAEETRNSGQLLPTSFIIGDPRIGEAPNKS